ncbi:hypothetical protein RO07_22710 [Pandoraea pulmonicola]|uniref:Uncharacterized protein n=1 Tax=Pandoraea pulmonicola TaxID=93221 RepID=A0ABM5S479_PANPU|nr:hypothetical protein RO07_22710 [Pandoraea pulmonicola]
MFVVDGIYIAGVPKEWNKFQLGVVPLNFKYPGIAINGIVLTLIIEEKRRSDWRRESSYLTEMVLITKMDSIGLKFTFK